MTRHLAARGQWQRILSPQKRNKNLSIVALTCICIKKFKQNTQEVIKMIGTRGLRGRRMREMQKRIKVRLFLLPFNIL